MISVEKSILFAAIVGGGCAGLTAAYRLEQGGAKDLAILEPNESRHDHIWAYWDDGGADLMPARHLATGHWKNWDFITDSDAVRLHGDRFVYRAVSSSSFENFVRENLRDVKQIREKVISAEKLRECFEISLDSGRIFYAKNLLDSRSPPICEGDFLQHFLGWQVRAEAPTFDEETATLMDFRVSQDQGIHFIYLLPFNSREALVESTVLSCEPLPDNWYERQITDYLSVRFPQAKTRITKKEKGIIPLVRYSRLDALGKPIGVRAGALRASSGYAFSQIQRQIFQMFNLSNFEKIGFDGISPAKPGCSHVESWMDRVFLEVLQSRPEQAPKLFLNIASGIDGDAFARFMRGYGDLRGRFNLMRSLPTRLFSSAILKRSAL